MLRSYLFNFSDAYIVVKETLNLETDENGDMPQKDVVLKRNEPYRSCITKFRNILIDNAEDLDIFMPMYNLS